MVNTNTNNTPHKYSGKVNWISISLSEIIKTGCRFEASVHSLIGKKARSLIDENPLGKTALIGEDGLSTSFLPNRFRRIWSDEDGIPIYQPSSITDLDPTPENYISKKTRANFDQLRAKFGQILLTRSGTIGKLILVTDTLKDKVFSDDLIRINPKQELDGPYIYTFFQTETGQTILTSSLYGAVIQHVQVEHLNNIYLPNCDSDTKQLIYDNIIESFYLRDKSCQILREAKELLLSETQLKAKHQLIKAASQNDICFAITLSSSEHRIDASFHLPKYNLIRNCMTNSSTSIKLLGDQDIVKSIFLPGRFKRVFVESDYGRVFFGGKQLNELDVSGKKYLSISKHSSRIRNDLELKENMILVSRSGTIGKTTLVPKHWVNWIASDHIIRIQAKNDVLAGYLYVFLSTSYGKDLIQKNTFGSVVDEIDCTDLAKIPIPILSNETMMDKIGRMALQANEMRFRSYVLEKQAIEIFNERVLHLGK